MLWIRNRLSEVSGCLLSLRGLIATVALLTAACGVRSASATTLDYVGHGLHKNVRINYLGEQIRVRTGENNLLLDDEPIVGYCVDLDHHIIDGPWEVAIEPVTSINGGRQAAYLFETFAPTVDKKDNAAALQLAIWEIVADWGEELDFSAGDFSVVGSKSIVKKAEDYLTALPAAINDVPRAWVLHSDLSQDMLVPEPVSLAMFVAAAGLIPFRNRPPKPGN